MTNQDRVEMINKMEREMLLRGTTCRIFTEKRETRQGLRLFYIVENEYGIYEFQGSLTELRTFIKEYNKEEMTEKYGEFGDSVVDYIESLKNNSVVEEEVLENVEKEEVIEIQEEFKELNNCDVEEYRVYQSDDTIAVVFNLDNGKILMSKSDEWGKKIDYKLGLQSEDLKGFKFLSEDEQEFHISGLVEYVLENLLDFGVNISIY